MSSLPTSAPEGGRRSGDERYIVAASRLTKVFKDFWMRDRARAVDGIDFHIERGEIFGLLGPNGSGKSTTIKLILGLLKRTGGRLQVFGRTPFDVSIKKRIGYLPEESYLYPFLNARETLDYYARLFRLDRKTRASRVDELLDMVGLTTVQHRPVREYSKGMQRRIGIAQALINDPEFLILDEPTTGLDPIGTRQVKDLILQLGRRGKTILLSSHLLADVEDCVDRMVILYGGKIREEGTCDTLLTSRERSVIETDRLDEETVAEIEQVLRRRGRLAPRVSAPRQRLEELFIDIVERARRERVETSGATNAGRTAGFLLGERGEAESLIERLVEGEPEPARGAPAEAPSAPAAQDIEGERGDVIESLVSGGDGAPGPAAAAPAPAEPGPDAPKPGEPGDVDRGLIDSLLDPGGSGDDKPEGGRAP